MKLAWLSRRSKALVRSEAGAVTVDWVVLTAAVGFLSLGIIFVIQSAATDTATGVGAEVLTQGTKSLE